MDKEYNEELQFVSERLVSFSEGKVVKGWSCEVVVDEDNRRHTTSEVKVQKDGSVNLFKFLCKKSKRTGERKFSPIVSEVVTVSTAKTEKFKEYVSENVNVLSDYDNWKTVKASIKKSDKSLVTGSGFELSTELRDIESRINEYSEEDYNSLINEYALALSEKAVSYLVADDFKKKQLEELKDFKKQVDLAIKSKQLECDNFRKFVKDVMTLSKTRKIETDLGSIFLSKKETLEIEDDKEVPEDYKVINVSFDVPVQLVGSLADALKTQYKIDIAYDLNKAKVNKKAVEEFVKNNSVAWAKMTENVSLGIRKKGGKASETDTD